MTTATACAMALACVLGCRPRGDDGDVEAREAAASATAEAEAIAEEATLTSATLEAEITDPAAFDQDGAEQARARTEVIAAFRLEQADYRGRLEHALDALDQEVARSRQGSPRDIALRQARERLKNDLERVDRATEPDWATLRTRVAGDLDAPWVARAVRAHGGAPAPNDSQIPKGSGRGRSLVH